MLCGHSPDLPRGDRAGGTGKGSPLIGCLPTQGRNSPGHRPLGARLLACLTHSPALKWKWLYFPWDLVWSGSVPPGPCGLSSGLLVSQLLPSSWSLLQHFSSCQSRGSCSVSGAGAGGLGGASSPGVPAPGSQGLAGETVVTFPCCPATPDPQYMTVNRSGLTHVLGAPSWQRFRHPRLGPGGRQEFLSP